MSATRTGERATNLGGDGLTQPGLQKLAVSNAQGPGGGSQDRDCGDSSAHPGPPTSGSSVAGNKAPPVLTPGLPLAFLGSQITFTVTRSPKGHVEDPAALLL